jgi:N-methylhydantoinase A
MQALSLNALVPGLPSRSGGPVNARSVYFKEAGRRMETPIYLREELAIGTRIAGPLIVEEYGSSTVAGPADELTVGALGELQIRIGG